MSEINRYEEKFIEVCLPNKHKNVGWDSCKDLSPSLIEFGKRWIHKPSSIFLCGGVGNGKTTYAFALIREMLRIRGDIWPRCYTSVDLDSKLCMASKSDDGDSYLLSQISSEDLLFIDDIGRETKSERLKRQYFEILNYRYVNELPTILTSNFSIDELADLIDESISSRMQEWQTFNFKGKDLRSRKSLDC